MNPVLNVAEPILGLAIVFAIDALGSAIAGAILIGLVSLIVLALRKLSQKALVVGRAIQARFRKLIN